MSELVGTPVDQFSRVAAQIVKSFRYLKYICRVSN